MSRRVSPSTDKVYGLQRVTRFWGVSRATVYRHRHLTQAVERKRPGPSGPCRMMIWWRRSANS